MNKYRNKILELFDEGLVGKDELVINLVNFLSESDAREFMEQYYDEDEDEDYDDDEPRWATKLSPGIPRF
ncbi:hypothetical protein EB001_22390 [bacterium]|nr:hypothetical protein [bacterium]